MSSKTWTKFKAGYQIYTTPFWIPALLKKLRKICNEAIFNHPFNYIPVKKDE